MKTHYEWEVEDITCGTRVRVPGKEELIIGYFMNISARKNKRYILVSLLDGCVYTGPINKHEMAKYLTDGDYERTFDRDAPTLKSARNQAQVADFFKGRDEE